MTGATTEQSQQPVSPVLSQQLVLGKERNGLELSDMVESGVISKLGGPPIAVGVLESHWRKALRSGNSLVTVRDIKAASPK